MVFNCFNYSMLSLMDLMVCSPKCPGKYSPPCSGGPGIEYRQHRHPRLHWGQSRVRKLGGGDGRNHPWRCLQLENSFINDILLKVCYIYMYIIYIYIYLFMYIYIYLFLCIYIYWSVLWGIKIYYWKLGIYWDGSSILRWIKTDQPLGLYHGGRIR